MQIAWIAEFHDGELHFRSADGDRDHFGIDRGTSLPLDESFCQTLAGGQASSVIGDSAEDPAVAGLEIAKRIRSYVGVPIGLPDGTLYGTLCCASRQPDHDLGERDVSFLRDLAMRVAQEIEDRRLGVTR